MTTLEQMIEGNKKKLIESCQKVIERVQQEDYNTIENLSYLQNDVNGVFQYGKVLIKQNKKLKMESPKNES